MSRNPINIKVGERVERLGNRCERPSTGDYLDFGSCGHVVEVKPPREGLGFIGIDEDGDEIFDEDRDGHAVVHWDTWGRALIWPDGEGKQWRRL